MLEEEMRIFIVMMDIIFKLFQCDRIELGTKKRGIVGIAVIQPAVGGRISEIRKRAALGEYHGNF